MNLSTLLSGTLGVWLCVWSVGWACSWPTWWAYSAVAFFLGTSLFFAGSFLAGLCPDSD